MDQQNNANLQQLAYGKPIIFLKGGISAAMLFRLGIFQAESFPGFFIISSGYLPSFIMNMLLVTAYCIRLATNRNIQPVPVWLGVANSVFLLFQLADLFL
jgi:hypothetical protein